MKRQCCSRINCSAGAFGHTTDRYSTSVESDGRRFHACIAGGVEYRLPPRFVFDHIGRDLLDGDRVVKSTTRDVYVELDADQYLELLCDAEWYCDEYRAGSFGGGHYIHGLARSAAATVRALKAQGSPLVRSA